MADTVLSVRVDEELKQRFIEIAQENGINNKEMMEVLVSQFELAQIGDGSAHFNRDIEELQRITKRMNELYLHLVERSQLQLLEAKNKDQLIKHEQQERIGELETKLKVIEEKDKELQALKDRLKLKDVEFQAVVEEQESIKDLNRLLRDKNSQLEKQMADSKAKLEAAQEILDDIARLRAMIQDQETIIRRQEYQIEKEKKEKEEIKHSFEVESEKNRQSLLAEWEIEKREHRLALEELKMELKQGYYEQLETVREEYEQKFDQLTKENQELLRQIQVRETN